ncbi:hypothetical protein L0F63_006056, partial [Massospora cicadina]
MPNLFKKFTDKAGSKSNFLQGITVQSLTGDTVLITDLWKDSTVILKVMRSFGCPTCRYEFKSKFIVARYESRMLANLKPEFGNKLNPSSDLLDKLNVKLVGIGFEEAGLQEFLDGKYWEWELYIDTERTVHRVLGLAKTSVASGLAEIFTSATRSGASKGGAKGDKFQL